MDAPATTPRKSWRPPIELGLLVLLVLGLYFTRIADPPLAGEEPRWACGAQEMLRTGDWIVPRQQGQIFPERPPLGSWAMALSAVLRGTGVDVVAIRLPSLLAVLITCLVVYGYSRNFLSPLGALAAGAVYGSFGQVLQIGRWGESEALFTLFISASLLVWHLGYSRSWPAVLVWSLGYALAALGALVKGPQAPVYFVAVTGAYLVLRRDWQWLLNWRHAAGAALFVLIVGAWQVPFYLAAGWPAVQAIWGGLAGDRFITQGLLQHIVTYPIELMVCLLPWSPLLLAFASRQFRSSLGSAKPMTLFLTTAILVTLPSVLFAALARGRYFMPLYPCLAVLIGLVIERCATVESLSPAGRGWRVFLLAWGGFVALLGVLVVAASFISIPQLVALDQPGKFAAAFASLGCLAGGILIWAGWAARPVRAVVGVLTLAAFTGLFQVGMITNTQCARMNPLEQHARAARKKIPATGELVSFGAVDHRFVYFYGEPITEMLWPLSPEDVPPGVTYFCMNRYPSDSPECRANGRGRTWTLVPGTLPVEWEMVAEVPFERRLKTGPQPVVVIGKIVRSGATQREDTLEYAKDAATQAELPTTRRRSN